MFKKKKEPDLQMKKWGKTMLSYFREDLYNSFGFVPVAREITIKINIKEDRSYHHETYFGSAPWYVGGDIVFHLMILDEGDLDLSSDTTV